VSDSSNITDAQANQRKDFTPMTTDDSQPLTREGILRVVLDYVADRWTTTEILGATFRILGTPIDTDTDEQLEQRLDAWRPHLSRGTYSVVVKEASPETTGRGLAIRLEFEVVAGPHRGAVIEDELPQTETELFRTVQFMQAIGLPTPRARIRVNIHSWIGKSLLVKVRGGEVRGFAAVPE
jgi:hypothetical protein